MDASDEKSFTPTPEVLRVSTRKESGLREQVCRYTLRDGSQGNYPNSISTSCAVWLPVVSRCAFSLLSICRQEFLNFRPQKRDTKFDWKNFRGRMAILCRDSKSKNRMPSIGLKTLSDSTYWITHTNASSPELGCVQYENA